MIVMVDCNLDSGYFQIFCLSLVCNYPCYFSPPLLQNSQELTFIISAIEGISPKILVRIRL
jgi:hypothetical protein